MLHFVKTAKMMSGSTNSSRVRAMAKVKMLNIVKDSHC